MGYWIIIILIVLCGVLVLLAAANVESGTEAGKHGHLIEAKSRQAPSRQIRQGDPALDVALIEFIPQMWLQDNKTLLDLEMPGVVIERLPVRSSMLSDVATAATSAVGLTDSVAVILVGADDFLAGHSLDTVLDDLDRLLDFLADQPAMAVVGSMPDVGSTLAERLTDVPAEAISATVATWNIAIADLVRSYSAEFVDLSAVPIRLAMADAEIPGLALSAVPEFPLAAAALSRACGRAAARVRSVQAET